MNRLLIGVIISLIVSSGIVSGQKNYSEVSEELKKNYGRLTDTYDDSTRLVINNSIRSLIEDYAYSDSIFIHRFDSLRYLGQFVSSDSLLKFLTWNLVLSNGDGRYSCYIIKKNNDGEKNIVYKLFSEYSDRVISADTTYNITGWYGALYYAARSIIVDSIRCWILLGIDYGNPYVTKKIIDVLSFENDSTMVFGRKIFLSENGLKYRHVFKYRADGLMTLRFDSLGNIIFDHLAPISGGMNSSRNSYGSDYSYDAYIMKDEVLRLKNNYDARNEE